MRVLILTHGTRGDVQPYAALAVALREAGHEAVLGAPASSAALARPYGLDYAPLDEGPNRLLSDPRIRRAMETNLRGPRGAWTALRALRRARPLLTRALEQMAGLAAPGVDAVVHMPLVPAQHIAEKLGVPAVPAVMQPGWVPTSAFTGPAVPRELPRALNRASYLPARLLLRSTAAAADHLRADVLGLAPRRGRHDILRAPDGSPATVLQAFSRHALPAADPGFPPWVHTTGFWFLPAAPGWSPPAGLRAFLEAGEPPVYIGFGSMVGRDPRRTGRLVAEAVRLAGVRAVLGAGWGGIRVEDPARDVFLLDEAPHRWLFPQVAAVVHHGGSGTTGAALAAGRPQVVCPFFADQHFWARAVRAAGVAPPGRRRALSAPGLAQDIRRALTDADMAGRAERLGRRVRAEDGAGTAVRVLESLA